MTEKPASRGALPEGTPPRTTAVGGRVTTNAVVTGRGSGIGRAVAHRLSADGLRVATIDLKPSDDKSAYPADVTDRTRVDATLAAITAELGPLSVLVNSAILGVTVAETHERDRTP